MKNADDIIHLLGMQKHPEGGYFSEVYRSDGIIKKDHLPHGFTSDHCFATSIYFLLKKGDFSAFHTIRQDENWHFYYGAPVILHIIHPHGRYEKILLGNNLFAGYTFQHVVPAGAVFGAEICEQEEFDYSLAGCTVSPGFEFEDFTLNSRAELLGRFPQHRDIIQALTR